MAETDDCAHRACLRIADVIVMHSVVIKATGSIVMPTGGLTKMYSPDREDAWSGANESPALGASLSSVWLILQSCSTRQDTIRPRVNVDIALTETRNFSTL